MTDPYVEAARNKLYGNVATLDDVDILDIVDASPNDGAWVTALIWVSDDELPPEPGPTYDVWIAEPDEWTWQSCGTTFTCDDDPDGKGARHFAHEHARYLRDTYPCAFVAVRRADKGLPLPVRCEA